MYIGLARSVYTYAAFDRVLSGPPVTMFMYSVNIRVHGHLHLPKKPCTEVSCVCVCVCANVAHFCAGSCAMCRYSSGSLFEIVHTTQQ